MASVLHHAGRLSMGRKEINLNIDPSSSVPLVQQVVNAVVDAIREGRLKPGAPLPGLRSLADDLGISVTPVINAFKELKTSGWIQAWERSGSRVSDCPPLDRFATSVNGIPAFDLPTMESLNTSQSTRIIKLSTGLPDYRLLPTDVLGSAFRSALRQGALDRQDETFSTCRHTLQQALVTFLGEWRRLKVDSESILITRGNRVGLSLVAKTLLAPGDGVAVEEPGNPMAWETFKQSKVRLLGIPVDDRGLRVDFLEEVLKTEDIRLLYVSPRFQIPTTVSLAQERRPRLLELAQRHSFTILEEDSEAEYSFSDPFPSPLFTEDQSGVVLYLSSFSRLLAPGLRCGFLVGADHLVSRLRKLEKDMGQLGDQILEDAILDLLDGGELRRHIHRVRKIYTERREMALALIERIFGNQLTVVPSSGGLSFWIQTDPRIDADQWGKRNLYQGLEFHTGRAYTLDRRPLNGLRLGYASFSTEEMEDLLLRMKQSLPTR